MLTLWTKGETMVNITPWSLSLWEGQDEQCKLSPHGRVLIQKKSAVTWDVRFFSHYSAETYHRHIFVWIAHLTNEIPLFFVMLVSGYLFICNSPLVKSIMFCKIFCHLNLSDRETVQAGCLGIITSKIIEAIFKIFLWKQCRWGQKKQDTGRLCLSTKLSIISPLFFGKQDQHHWREVSFKAV